MILVTPPAGAVVSLSELKGHPSIRVDHADEDAALQALEAEAVSLLDGWAGLLGRAIKPQTWRAEIADWGVYVLPLPDVSAVAVTYMDAAGIEQPATKVALRQSAGRTIAEIEGPAASRIFLNMTCAMSAQMLPTAKAIITMLVAARYNGAEQYPPMAAQALINTIRWGRI